MKEMGRSFPDCARCRGPGMESTRENWGCDAPAAHVVYSIECGECRGAKRPECKHCGGSGKVEFNRCPSSVLRESGRQQWLDAILRTYRQYSGRNVLPMEGGYAEQTASWTEAVDILDAAQGHWDGEAQRARDKKAEAQRQKSERNRQSQPKSRR